MIPFLLAGSILSGTGAKLFAGEVEVLAEGFQFTEGPAWLPSGQLVFSDIPADTIYRADKSIYRRPSGKSNGLAVDPAGRLVACEHGNRRVTREESDGALTVLAERYKGHRLNSPNDVAIRSDGTVFFTDPPYGLEGRPQELPFQGVFAVLPTGDLKLLAEDFVKPNGLALSPDERTLFIADTERGHVRAFSLGPDAFLSEGPTFCDVERPDGIKTDCDGRLWATSVDGIAVFAPDGQPLGRLELPQRPANCVFGDSDGRTLYITARTAVYRVRCFQPGFARPPVE